jgi:hypothetical protein
MGNNLCSDVGNDALPIYRNSKATGTALMQKSKWYDSQSKT